MSNNTPCHDCASTPTHDRTQMRNGEQGWGMYVDYFCPQHAPPDAKPLEEEDLGVVIAVIAELMKEAEQSVHRGFLYQQVQKIAEHYASDRLQPEDVGRVRMSVFQTDQCKQIGEW